MLGSGGQRLEGTAGEPMSLESARELGEWHRWSAGVGVGVQVVYQCHSEASV
jgi:hypothetical protein